MSLHPSERDERRRGMAPCPDCGRDVMYGKHLNSEVCAPPTVRCTDEELQRLYAALDRIELRPGDLIPELRREGKRIRFLSELSSFEVRKLIKECEKHHQQKRVQR